MTAEHAVSRCAEKAMELHHLTPRDLARAIGCGEGSIYNLLNERPVQFKHSQYVSLLLLAGVLNFA